MSAMNFWVARARRRCRGRGVRGAGGRPARRRWWDVTASGIWRTSGFVRSVFVWFGFGGEESAEYEGRNVVGGMAGHGERVVGG